MGEAIQELHQEHGVSEEGLKRVLPSSWVRWALEPQGENGSRQPTVEELAAHDGESTTPRKAQQKLGKVVKKIQLESLRRPWTTSLRKRSHPRGNTPFGGSEGKELALARVRSSQGPGGTRFSERHPPTGPEKFPPTSSFTPRGEPWESKSSWRKAAPDAIEAEMVLPSQLCMHEPVHEMVHRLTCTSL